MRKRWACKPSRPRRRRLAPRPRDAAWNCGSPRSSRPARSSCRFISRRPTSNEVTQSAFDPISREPNYKQCAVRVEQNRSIERARRMRADNWWWSATAWPAWPASSRFCKHAPKFEITIFGDETHVNYNRILLSSVLAGEKSADDIVLNGLDWYEKNGIDLRLGVRIVDVDPTRKTVTGDDGSVTAYDKLMLATGSSAFIPPIDGVDKEGVFVFRNLDDTRASARARPARAEGRGDRRRTAGPRSGARPAGAGLRRHRRPPDGHADGAAARSRPAASYLASEDGELGITRPAGRSTTAALLGNGTWKASTSQAASSIEAELVVIAAGIRPNVELGAQGRARSQPRHRRQRLHGDVGPATSSPSANACEHNGACLRAGRAAVRTGQSAGRDHHRQQGPDVSTARCPRPS